MRTSFRVARPPRALSSTRITSNVRCVTISGNMAIDLLGERAEDLRPPLGMPFGGRGDRLAIEASQWIGKLVGRHLGFVVVRVRGFLGGGRGNETDGQNSYSESDLKHCGEAAAGSLRAHGGDCSGVDRVSRWV